MKARVIAAALAAAGCGAMLLLGMGWQLVLGWAIGAILVAVVWRLIEPRVRLSVAVSLLAFCLVLVGEGGLFLAPSAIALIVDSLSRRRIATA
jgi:hypothetical protein